MQIYSYLYRMSYLCLLLVYAIFICSCDNDKQQNIKTNSTQIDSMQQIEKKEKTEIPIILQGVSKNKIPKEVEDFIAQYQKYIHKQNNKNLKNIKEAKKIRYYVYIATQEI